MQGRIATFYSYKGGTGRSMALANFAWILAASGKRVLVVDWDLEAPGLHRYFRPFLVDPDLSETDGLIDMFWTFTASALERSRSGKETPNPQIADVAEALEDATRKLDSKFFPGDRTRKLLGGCIDFIGAGRQGGTYSERVNSFDWRRFYELGGAEWLSAMKTEMRARYDWILIDSRTGVSDTSGICTIQMPEMVVAFFTLNRQSIDGVAAILQSIRSYHNKNADGGRIKFFPIATRIENAEQVKLEIARGYARAALREFLPETMQSRPREYWDIMEVTYRPAYAFEEVLAVFGDATGPSGAADTMLSQFEKIGRFISEDKSLRVPEILDSDRKDVLDRYAFGLRTALPPKEPQPGDDNEFLRNMRAKEQLWRTSDFSWRFLLSRRELDLLTEDDRKRFGRNMTYYLVQSERMHHLLLRSQIVTPSFLGIIIIAAVTVMAIPFPSLDYLHTPYFYIRLLYGAILAWPVLLLIMSLAVAKPYGLGTAQAMNLFIMGPFHPKIPDFHPDKLQRPAWATGLL